MLGFIKRHLLNARKKYEIRREYKRIVDCHYDVSDYDEKKVFDARKYGFSFAESKRFNFPKNNYKDYISTWEAYLPRLRARKTNTNISDDKLLFSLVFGNVVEVPTVYATITEGKVCSVGQYNVDNENIYDFLVQNGGVIKDRSGYNGYNVFVFDGDGSKLFYKNAEMKKEQFIEILESVKGAILQKKIVQGSFERGLFGDSVNTLRIISLKKKDENEHEIIGAVQRIGTKRSAPVDNFSQGGGSALIDLETGELSSFTLLDSFDQNGERIFYDKHPDTGAQIKGIKIPNWEQIKEKIIDITRRIPLFDFVAWDIALTDDGIAVIETNMKSTLGVFQVHGGMRNEYLGQKYKEYGYIKD